MERWLRRREEREKTRCLSCWWQQSEAARLQSRKDRGSDMVGKAGREIEIEVLEERKRGSPGDLK